MANRFANGRKAFGFCDVCGFRFDLKRLKNLVVKTKQTEIKACPQCWTPDQPQLQLGMYPIADPQALRNPRPDTNTWYQSGVNALGNVSEGMLVTQWGWNPVGGARDFDAVLTPNALVGVGQVGQATFTPWTSLLFTTPGTYSWTAPIGVTQIYVLCVGAGGGGGPTAIYAGGNSSFGTFFAGGGGSGTFSSGGAGGTGTPLSATVFGGNGGNGGDVTPFAADAGGGGGAGGYSGNGGNANKWPTPASAGSGGAGAGGNSNIGSAIGGGGVGLNGEGPSGLTSGRGGSGGTNGNSGSSGIYGGGGRGKYLGGTSGGGGGGGLRWAFLPVTPGVTYPVVVGNVSPNIPAFPGRPGAVRINYLPVP